MKRGWIVLMLGIWVFVSTCVAGLAEEKKKITHWSISPKVRKEAADTLFREYERLNPEVEISHEAMAGPKYNEKIVIALAGGGGPDIYIFKDSHMASFLPKGWIEPLDLKVFGFRDLEAYEVTWLPNALKPFIKEGKLYGLPRELNIYSMLINTDAFKESGLDPKKDYPRTWDEVVTVGKKLVRRDASGYMTREAVHFPFKEYWGWYMLFLGPYMNALGGDYLSEDGTRATINEEPGVASLQYWYDVYYKHQIASIDRAEDSQYVEVGKGTIAMFPGASWAGPTFSSYDPDFLNRYDIVPAPSVNGKKAVNLTTWAYCVNSSSENKLESMKILDYLTADPGTWLERTGNTLPRSWIFDTPQARNMIGRDAWKEDAKYARPMLVHENTDEIGAAFIRAVQRTLYDRMPAKESLDMMADEVNKIIAGK